MTSAGLRRAGTFLAAIDDLSGRRMLRWTSAALFLVAAPGLAWVQQHRTAVDAWHYYAGDTFLNEHGFPYRLAAVGLVERAAYLMGGSPSDGPRYRWTSREPGPAAGFVETGRGVMPLAPVGYPRTDGGTSGLQVARNGLGAIVLALTDVPGSYCAAVSNWSSAYVRARARAALVDLAPDGKLEAAAVDRAAWIPFVDGMDACRARGDRPTTVLVRLDGPGGTAGAR